MKFVIALFLTVAVGCSRSEESSSANSTASAATTSAISTTSITSTTTQPSTTLAPAPAPAGAEPVAGPKLTPVDQGASDPTFAAYREQLRAAVKAHDVKATLALVDPKIRTSFGDRGGVSDFEKTLAKPGAFAMLEQLLSLGGTFLGEGDSRSFWAPYVYSAWPEERDAFTHVAVIGENVPLRKRAAADAEIVATLSHDILERPKFSEEPWQEVKTADGRSGFVETKQVWSPVGYRAGFNKKNGEWKMTALVAGD
ncbi:MAG TPA: SH3 domain-containing protein [Thermoanaerobaculia bacterium]|nr:SH3 domain-containing protein [Thermoanaerobaculia bacterium]